MKKLDRCLLSQFNPEKKYYFSTGNMSSGGLKINVFNFEVQIKNQVMLHLKIRNLSIKWRIDVKGYRLLRDIEQKLEEIHESSNFRCMTDYC